MQAYRGAGLFLSIVMLAAFATSAQWVQTNGPDGGRVCAFTVNEGYLFAGMLSSGIFRSADNGAGWAPANSGLPSGSVSALAMCGSYLFAGTSGYEGGPAGYGIYRTADNGATWTAVNSGLPAGTSIYALAVSNGYILAATYDNGIYRSADTGTHWTAVISTILRQETITTFALSGGYLFAQSGGTVLRSADNGATWISPNSGIFLGNINAFMANGGYLFAAASGTHNVLIRSADNGATWDTVTQIPGVANVYAFAVSGSYLFAGTQGNGVWRRPLSDFGISVRTNWPKGRTFANNGLCRICP